MEERTYLFMCRDNTSGEGTFPVYFDNAEEAKKFGSQDYCSYYGIVNLDSATATGNPVPCCSTAEEANKGKISYHTYGIGVKTKKNYKCK